jgi:hypothetical protein
LNRRDSHAIFIPQKSFSGQRDKLHVRGQAVESYGADASVNAPTTSRARAPKRKNIWKPARAEGSGSNAKQNRVIHSRLGLEGLHTRDIMFDICNKKRGQFPYPGTESSDR